ncbi:GTP-binding protein YchF [Candidatus Trichorickettsia mobilis]|uniref:Ribosome-binding ATPase YchF n=1 Tax=Candidatus Trichorickettsia mobilis TaxID=1346319 RepID=A0ABZ0USV1_9RICK|nr:redox-regulated ATPase YchF [Candidatus Trichorickettsia mobilis]WPY01113.1 GTP-binding protein YchF [Candidatus Trichorickettsia mobilis]
MTLKCGIVGLPNVGKSTLFNALTASQAAAAANYPFCTIEPNTGITVVPDDRLEQLATIAGSGKIIPAYIEFVDIAGLVKGASKGEGLGNKFLSHIREVDAILHVLRCFEDDDITHVHGAIDPLHDAEIIETELILADLESVERRLAATQKRVKTGDKTLNAELDLLQAVYQLLSSGKPARDLIGKGYDKGEISRLQLLTAKPVLYVCNVLEQEACSGNEFTNNIADKTKKEQAESIIISSKIEAEIANLTSVQEKIEFLDSIGLAETGLSKIIKASYNLLNLQSFFTVGPKEVHAWTFKIGTFAPEAAGIIHTDFEKGFIRAEVISYNDYISCKGEVRAKETGKMRLEGKEYRVQDGDIVHFRFNL